MYPAPFAVFLNKDEKNYVEPDITVVCDKDKLNDKGCSGAPDWVVEIASPSTAHLDYGVKLFKYRTTQVVNVYDLEHGAKTNQYKFSDQIPSCIYSDFSIQPLGLLP